MANTSITLINDGGIYLPSVPSVAVVADDTISFATSDGSAVLLFFSPDAASVLSPAPASPFALATGATADFAFTSSAPGAYSVYFGPNSGSAPPSFPTQISQALMLEIGASSTPPPFGGPHDTTGPGS